MARFEFRDSTYEFGGDTNTQFLTLIILRIKTIVDFFHESRIIACIIFHAFFLNPEYIYLVRIYKSIHIDLVARTYNITLDCHYIKRSS